MKYPRNRKKPKLAPSQKAVTAADWGALAASPREAEAYTLFTQELQRAHAEATQRASRMGPRANAAELLDVGRAVSILDQHPALYRYVRAAAQREHRERILAQTAQPALLKGPPTGSTPQAEGVLGYAFAGARQAPISVPNARQLRQFADAGEWLRAAINIRRDQVAHAEITVLPQEEDAPYSKAVQTQILTILDQPNEYRQNWPELIAEAVEDILVLDRGVISKSMTMTARQPTALYVEDGATIAIYPAWSGRPEEPRYLYTEPGSDRRVALRNDEAIVMMANPASHRFGLAPVQVLWETLKADLKATQLAMQLVEQKPPPHMVQIPGYSQSQLVGLANEYLSNYAGRKELFFIGGQENAQVFPLVFSAKDNQFLEWQTWLARKICALMRISPQQIGITMDINKATGETQQDISEDTGLLPLLLTVESYLNREFLADFAPTRKDGRADMTALNLRACFPQISEGARMLHAKETLAIAQQALAGLPSMTINQALAMRGEEPVPGGDTFYMPSQSGAIPWLSYNNELGDYVTDPTAPSPALGAQDAAGGPQVNQPDDAGAAPADDKPRSAAQTPQGNEQAAGGSAPAQQQSKKFGWDDGTFEIEPEQWHLPGKHDQSTHGRRYGKLDMNSDFNKLSGVGEKAQYLKENGANEWVMSLSNLESSAVMGYTGSSFGEMNSALRGGGEFPGPYSAGKVQNLDAALAKSAGAPADMIVYRGMYTMPPGLEAGKVFVDKGYVSTSISHGFSGDIKCTISVFKGAKGAYVEDLSSYSSEREWLIPRGARFKVLSVVKDSSGTTQVNMAYMGSRPTKLKIKKDLVTWAAEDEEPGIAKDRLPKFTWQAEDGTVEDPDAEDDAYMADKEDKEEGSAEKALRGLEQWHLPGKHDQSTHGRRYGKLDMGSGFNKLSTTEEKAQYLGDSGGAAWEAGLSNEEKQALKYYTGAGYEQTNPELRAGKVLKGYPKEAATGIDSALAKSKGAPADMVVYRGISPDMEPQVKVGKVFSDAGYSSSSISSEEADWFARHGGMIATISVFKGSPGAYIANESLRTGEHEWLFPRGARFKVLSITKGKAYTEDGHVIGDRTFVNLAYMGSRRTKLKAFLRSADETPMPPAIDDDRLPRYTWAPGDVDIIDPDPEDNAFMADKEDAQKSLPAPRPEYPIVKKSWTPPTDHRPVGVAWRPPHHRPPQPLRRAAAPNGRAQRYQEPPGVLQAKADLGRLLDDLFAEVERDGAQVLRRLEGSE